VNPMHNYARMAPWFLLLAWFVSSAQNSISTADVQRLSDLSDQVKSAIQAGDVNRAEHSASDLFLSLIRLRQASAPTPAAQLQKLEQASTENRFYALADLAKAAFDAGDLSKAKGYANELLSLAPQNRKDWNYGNAIYYSNFVLGRVALRDGDVAGGKIYLLAAARTPGSPQLNSFGPNVTLAKELLNKGERDAVLEYFALCRSFWKLDRGLLDEWSATVRGGGIPEFRSNTNY
jgi:hypothetical protein